MKKVYRALLIIALTCLLTLPGLGAGAQTIPAERQKPRFVDEVGLLTEAEAGTLLALLDEISERQACDVAIAVAATLGGKTSTAYADDFFDYNGYGMGPNDDGIILIICLEERDWAISTHAFAIDAFTDSGQEYIMDKVLPDLSAGNYAAAFTTFADQCDTFLTAARDGRRYDGHYMPDTPPLFSFASFMERLIITLPVGAVLSFIITLIMKARLKTVRFQPSARDYIRPGSFNLVASRDMFLYRTVSRTRRASDSGGGSSTHTSSSGRSHGGSSGKF